MRIHGAAAVAMAVLAAAAVAVAAGPGLSPHGPQSARAARTQPAISVSGNVAGLYPGAAKRVRLRILNRSPRTRTVTSVRGRALDAGPGCSAGNVKARKRSVRLRIPPGSKRRLAYRIAMVPDAADGCQGASFPIRYRAKVR